MIFLSVHGKQSYDNIAYFNFDEQEELAPFFETTKDVKRILQNLMMVNGSPVLPEKTLVIFDEIQECNKALNTLKYGGTACIEIFLNIFGNKIRRHQQICIVV